MALRLDDDLTGVSFLFGESEGCLCERVVVIINKDFVLLRPHVLIVDVRDLLGYEFPSVSIVLLLMHLIDRKIIILLLPLFFFLFLFHESLYVSLVG